MASNSRVPSEMIQNQNKTNKKENKGDAEQNNTKIYWMTPLGNALKESI